MNEAISRLYEVVLKRIGTLQKIYDENRVNGNFITIVEVNAKMEELRRLLLALDVIYK